MKAFDAMTAAVDYPMYVVTTVDAATGERAGCLVGFATQCSIDPARFLVCLSEANHTFAVAGRAEVLAVHLLAASQRELAELFGSETGDRVDKFARCEWREGPSGVPVLCDASMWFAGPVVDRVDLGDHVGYVVEPVDGSSGSGSESGPPFLTFHMARSMEPGHEA